jgi:hypothetical protein
MFTSPPQCETAPSEPSGPQGSTPHVDWFRFATMPAATWLTQVMAAQKVIEAVWRQGVLTADMLGPNSNAAEAGRADPFAGHASAWQSLLKPGVFRHDR